jgi:hypothetical protein
VEQGRPAFPQKPIAFRSKTRSSSQLLSLFWEKC